MLTLAPTALTACGKRVSYESVSQQTYSADSFLQRYGIRPDQVGLNAPITELLFNFPPPRMVCGNSEGLVLLTDGHHAALEDGNDYFRLTKVDMPLTNR